MLKTISTIAARVRTIVTKNAAPFLVLHLCFTALALLLFTPLLGLLFRLAMQFSPHQVLADADIVYFFLSPYGSAALIAFSAFLLTVVVFEQGTMMAAYIAAADGGTISILHIFSRTAAHWLTILRFSINLAVRLLLIVFPFLAAAGAVYLLALGRFDINYYLSARPPIFILAAVLIASIVVVMLLVLVVKLLSWSLTLPLILFQQTEPKKSFARSAALVSGGKKLVALLLISWGLCFFLTGLLLAWALRVSSYHLVPIFSDSMPLLLSVIGFLVCLLLFMNFILTGLASASFSGLVVELGRHFGQPVHMDDTGAAGKRLQINLSLSRLAFMSIMVLAASLAAGFWLVDSMQPPGDVAIIAHRGAAGRAPENTMAAVKAAVEDEADWVEIDVQESLDGEVLVIHDSDFMKLAGVNMKVWEGSLEQIRNIDVGRWFAPSFAGERVPTLADVLKECRGKANVLIELKYYGHDERLEQRVVDVVEAAEMVDEVAVMSLKSEAVQKLRNLRPDWTAGLLSTQVIGSMARLEVDFLAVNKAMANRTFIKSNQEAGKRVYVWTINDRVSMFTMMTLGVDGIITDEPALARRVMAERAELNPVERLLVHAAVRMGKPLPAKLYRDRSP